jgi:hypothetical protein
MARRVVLALLTTVLWAGTGSALLSSTAAAGGLTDDGQGHNVNWTAGFYNFTPYRWTLVKTGQGLDCDVYNTLTDCWDPRSGGKTPQTMLPGQEGIWELRPNTVEGDYGLKIGYDGYLTYRVDLLGASPVYVTFSVTQCQCSGAAGSSEPLRLLFFTSQPPPDSWTDHTQYPPNGLPCNPCGMDFENADTPTHADLIFTPTGNFTIDASTPQGQPFVDALNAICPPSDSSGDPPTLVGGSCSFTQTTPLTYGPGTLGGKQQANNCDLSSAAPGGQPSSKGEAPPDNDPNYYLIEYSAAQSASLTVGGGITVSTEFSLFNTISSEASVSVEAEHEWEEVKTYTRESKVFIPSNSWGFLWVAPTVGRVTGTLVATIGSSTITANNFTEVRSGVSAVTDPLKQPTPAFNTVTKTRPMNAAEKTKFCGTSASSRASASPRQKARRAAPPAGLVPHRSVARVALGETQEAVVARLGWPAEKRFQLNPCKGMPACAAVQGLGGTWNYKERNLSVVFGADRRVVALIHDGNRRTKDGVGKDSSMAQLHGKFPRIACAKVAKRVDCTVRRVSGQQAIRTVFRLGDRLPGQGTRWKTNKVLIYVERRERGNA